MTSTIQFIARLWDHLWSTKQRARQVGIAGIAITISLWIGFRYAEDVFVSLLPIIVWVYLMILCCLALYPNHQRALIQISLNLSWLGLLLLLGVAILLRGFHLSSLPPGLHPDEAGYIDFALLHIPSIEYSWLYINPFRTGLDSQPILYSYVLWLNTLLFGSSILAVKISSVLIGTLSVAGAFLMMKEITGNRRLAWLMAILMAFYHYHIHWSRLALSNIWTNFFLCFTIGLFLLGWRKRHSGGAVLAGVCLGLTTYVYSGGYFVVILLAILFLQLWHKTTERLGLTIYSAKMVAIATVIAAPLIVFAFRVPEFFFGRANMIRGWTPPAILAYSQGAEMSYLDYAIHQFQYSFGAYNFFPEVTGFYQPGIPFLIGFASILFMVGIVLAFKKTHSIALVWILIVTFMGGILLDGTPGSTHFIGAIPAICWLVALPIDKLFESGNHRLAYAILAVIIFTDLYFYFVVYAGTPSPDLSLSFPIVVR